MVDVEAAASERAGPDRTADPAARPHVLLVEDESLVALMMEDLLRDCGCRVTIFGALEPAMDWLAAQDAGPDGAVLDVNLNGTYVFPLAEALQARGVPFIFATGYPRLPEGRFRQAPLLQKPVDPAKLAPLVRRFGASE